MKNRDIFQRDPNSARLLNDGVVAVGEGTSTKELETLRYELENFVCEGQYKEGLLRILGSFLGNVGQPGQPAAWISGFFGSGKSHLLKMLRHLWMDTRFADGATARGLAHLPVEVKDAFQELSTVGKRCGRLHAAAGTLPSGSGHSSARLTVLSVLLQSKGLPETLPQARFCLWLRKNGHYDAVSSQVEKAGKPFLTELQDLYVSPLIAKALLTVDPHFAPDEKQARKTLREQFPLVPDVSTAEFVRLVREILGEGGPLPATILILDEVQLFIGDNDRRSTDVQEVAEALCKQMDSRVLLIGAGQTALAGSLPQLQRLRGRFTIPVELSDMDVETVTRRVVLAKKADKIKAVEECLAAHAGEIDRQLAGTTIATRAEDRISAVEDYPLLPVRRRFWEKALQAVDTPGTAAQLRNQLRIVHDAIREIAPHPLGHVVPADVLFTQLQPDLLRTQVLLREIDENIRKLDDGSPSGRLARRLCGLIFLIRKLPREAGADIGVRATADVLADLLVSDLAQDGATLRREVPLLLEKLVEEGKLIKLPDGYSLQTRDSSEWEREFRGRLAKLAADLTGLSTRRTSLIAAACEKAVGSVKLRHGRSKEPRNIALHFGEQPPTGHGHTIPVWIRDGWGSGKDAVLADARAGGISSPVVYVFIPKASADDLKKAITEYEAAKATLDFKGTPSSGEGSAREAREAMLSRMRESESRRDDIIRQVVEAAEVYQGGGTEVYQLSFMDKVRAVAEASLDRLFPDFHLCDHDKWDTVMTRAKNGAEDALKAVGFNDKPDKHPICSAILSILAAGKRGKDVRAHFQEAPTGWPKDGIDACLIVLHTTGHIRALLNGTPLAVGGLKQENIAGAELRVESPTLDLAQKLKLRKMYQSVGIACKPNEESQQAGSYLARLADLAQRAGGEAPLPERPQSRHLDDLRALVGNEQLSALLAQETTLTDQAKVWTAAADLAAKRLPAWDMLQRLLGHASQLQNHADLQSQVTAVRAQRRLLDSADPVPALLQTTASALRLALNAAHAEYAATHERERARLESSESWQKLSAEQRQGIQSAEGLAPIPLPDLGDDTALVQSLDAHPLSGWKTRTQAIGRQFANAALAAAKLLEPKVQHVHLTSGTLRTSAEVKSWLAQTEASLLEKLSGGPIVVQ